VILKESSGVDAFLLYCIYEENSNLSFYRSARAPEGVERIWSVGVLHRLDKRLERRLGDPKRLGEARLAEKQHLLNARKIQSVSGRSSRGR
jgi:hypothetical protein